MKWFKHFSDSLDDPFIQELMDEFKHQGYVAWFGLLEIISKENGNHLTGKLEIKPEYLKRKLRISITKLELLFNFCLTKHKLIFNKNKEKWFFEVPKLLILKDNYTKDLQATNKKPSNHKEVEVEVEAKEEVDKKDKNKELIVSVVDYINKKLGTNYKAKTEKTKTCINARIEEGNKFEQFKTVIDKKYDQWFGTDDAKYLRPETLFGNKFEGYLNQLNGSKSKTINKLSFEKYKEAFIWKKDNPEKKFNEDCLNKVSTAYPFINEYDFESAKFELTYKEYLKL